MVTFLSVYHAAYVFVSSVFGENIPSAEFGMISAETACWDKKENSQIFNGDFYFPLYLPLWLKSWKLQGLGSETTTETILVQYCKSAAIDDITTDKRDKDQRDTRINQQF